MNIAVRNAIAEYRRIKQLFADAGDDPAKFAEANSAWQKFVMQENGWGIVAKLV